MDLIKLDLEPLEFRYALYDVECAAITPWTAKKSGALRTAAAMTSMLGGMTCTMLPLMALAFWAMGIHVILGLLAILTMFLGALGAGMYGFMRYMDPPDRKLLPLLFEPQARDFFLANADRRERLIEESQAFDWALQAFKALPERAGDEVDAGVVENFTERRARLKAAIDAYVRDFDAATADDRARVTAIKARRGSPRSPRKRTLKAFADKVGKLRRIENSLDALEGSSEKGLTVDLSPYVAAQRLRRELEEERAALVERGLKPKALPKPRISRKFLPA